MDSRSSTLLLGGFQPSSPFLSAFATSEKGETKEEKRKGRRVGL